MTPSGRRNSQVPAPAVAGRLQDGFGSADHLGVLLAGQERGGRLLHQPGGASAASSRGWIRRRCCRDHRPGTASRRGGACPGIGSTKTLAPAEGSDRLTGGGVEQLGDLLHGARDLHPAAATAEDRLDGDRETELLREGDDLVAALDRVGGARDHVRVGLGGDEARLDFVAQGLDRLRGWADPDQPGVENCLRK